MEIFPILMNGIFNFCGNNNSNLRSDTHLTRPILHTAKYGIESIIHLLILGQKCGTWYHEAVKKRTPYLVLKARLRSGYEKTLSVVFV